MWLHFPLAHKSRRLRVIDKLSDRPIPDALDSFVDHVQRYDKPLPGFDRPPKAILDRQVKLNGAEQAMEHRESALRGPTRAGSRHP